MISENKPWFGFAAGTFLSPSESLEPLEESTFFRGAFFPTGAPVAFTAAASGWATAVRKITRPHISDTEKHHISDIEKHHISDIERNTTRKENGMAIWNTGIGFRRRFRHLFILRIAVAGTGRFHLLFRCHNRLSGSWSLGWKKQTDHEKIKKWRKIFEGKRST